MKRRKISSIVLVASAVALFAAWIYGKNTIAGLSGALILAYLAGLPCLLLNAVSCLLGLPAVLYSTLITLPVISMLHEMAAPLLAKTILPLLIPLQPLLSRIGPLKWISDRLRNVKSVKMKRCLNCRRNIPADSVSCPYCGVKAKHGRKNAPHKKRGA